MTSVTTNSCSNLNMAGFNILNITTVSSTFANISSATLSNLNVNGGTISNVASIYVENFTGTLNLAENNIINVKNITTTLVTASTIIANVFSGTLIGSASKLSPGASINGQLFDGTTTITITSGGGSETVYASSLAGTTLAVNVIYSSLETVGNLTSLTMAGTLDLAGNNIINIGNLTSTIVTTSTLTAENITATFAIINTVTNNILFSSTITSNNISATVGTVDDFTSSTISANTITATMTRGNFSSDEFINFPTATLSTNVINSIVVSGNRYAPWGARIGSSSLEIATSGALNNRGDIVVTGTYLSSPLLIYNAGGTTVAFTLISSGIDEVYVVKYNSAGTAQWGARIAGTLTDTGNAICLNDQGNMIAVGQYGSSPLRIFNAGGTTQAFTLINRGSNDTFITMYNTLGTAQWATRIAGTLSDTGTGVACNQSDIIVTGYYTSTPLSIYNNGGIAIAFTLFNVGNQDSFIVRYNSYGYAQWATRIAGTSVDYSSVVDMNTGGDIVILGYTGTNSTLWVYGPGGTTIQFTLTSSGDYDAYIVKYNSVGTPQWVTKVGGTSADGGSIIIGGISINNIGDIVATGNYSSSPLWVYNADGTTIAFTLNNSGSIDAFIVKWNSSGIAQWATRVAGTDADYGTSVSLNDFGDIVTTGYYNSSPVVIYNAGGTTIAFSLQNPDTDNDTFIVKWNSLGTAQWATRISGTGYSIGRGIDLNELGEIAVIGYYISTPLVIYNSGGTVTAFTLGNSGSGDVFIVKYVDEINVNLPNPTENGQEKSIKSIGPKVIVTPSGYINNSTASIAVYTGENLNLIWDSTNNNWNVKENELIPQTNEMIFGGNGLDSLKISGAGQVTKPYNCNVLAGYNTFTVATISAGVLTQLFFTNKIYDVNNNYNTSSGTFTAPITGVYFLSGNISTQSLTATNPTNLIMILYKNDIAYVILSKSNPSQLSTTAALQLTYSFSIPLLLTAGDQLKIRILATGVSTYLRGTDSDLISPLTYFSVMLVS